MRELGLAYRHVGASDISAGPQKFVLRNHKPEKFWPNVFHRSARDLRDVPVGAPTKCGPQLRLVLRVTCPIVWPVLLRHLYRWVSLQSFQLSFL